MSNSKTNNTLRQGKGQARPKFDWLALRGAIAFYESEHLCYLPAGWGRKNPSVKWEQYQTRLPTIAEKTEWFHEGKATNVGVLCGAVSGGLVIFAFNDQNGAREFFGEERWQRLPQTTFITKSIRGHHVWLRAETPIQSQKIGKGKNESWLEIRSDGNFTVAPPSLHPKGILYQAIGVDRIYKSKDLAEFINKRLSELGLTARVTEEAPREKAKPPARGKPERSEKSNQLAIEKLLESCAFIQYCRDNAITLSEPWWWSMVHILAVFGGPGRDKIHALSAPYPRYTERETDKKIKEALKAAGKEIGPHTCLFIEQDLGFACPENCQAKSLGVKSPAGLATRLATRKIFNLTDLGNAERLVKRHGENIRYSEERKRWLIWNGKVWEWDFGAKVMALAKETARNILHEAADEKDDEKRKELIKHAVRSESEARLTAMVNLAQSEPRIPVQGKELNSNPWRFNCLNGTVDLRTGELLPHKREDLITIMSPGAYVPDTRCELWLKFLDRVTGGNTELARYLQRGVGYSLTGDTRAQVMFFLYGLGNNGKSTFIATVRKMVGGYGATAPVDMFLTKDKTARGPKEDLANLQGKRFVAASEVEVGRRLAVVVIKEMTGGEAIRADRKYEHEIEFQPTHKLWIGGNHKPVIADASLAIWRRIKLIPFTVTIPDAEIDQDLPLKLEAELPGILAWAVEGCLVWQKEGLKEPREVTAATLAYRDEEDILAEYIQDRCVLKATATVSKADLHENYKQWCENTGVQPISQKTLRTRLMERGITDGKSGSIRYWRGIGLSEGQEQKEGHLGQEMTIFPENHIREKIHEKVQGKPVPAVPSVPEDVKENILGKPIPEVIVAWTKAGKPLIHLGPGRNCLDLENFLGGPATEEDLKAVRGWMERRVD